MKSLCIMNFFKLCIKYLLTGFMTPSLETSKSDGSSQWEIGNLPVVVLKDSYICDEGRGTKVL